MKKKPKSIVRPAPRLTNREREREDMRRMLARQVKRERHIRQLTRQIRQELSKSRDDLRTFAVKVLFPDAFKDSGAAGVLVTEELLHALLVTGVARKVRPASDEVGAPS